METKEKRKSIWAEFKEFAMRGNVVDLAVGVIIGASFNKIVTALVTDILMPPLGLLLGKVDLSHLYISLTSQQYRSLAEATKAKAPIIQYGDFLNSIIDFVIVAFVIFLLVKQINRLNKKPASTHACPFCAEKISLKATRCPYCTSALETRD